MPTTQDKAASQAAVDAETTKLSPLQELLFQAWTKARGVTDVDEPDTHYDYRGFWKDTQGSGRANEQGHYPDTFKQHGHPTFSVESQYSKGPFDGGMWIGNTFLPPMDMATGHEMGAGQKESGSTITHELLHRAGEPPQMKLTMKHTNPDADAVNKILELLHGGQSVSPDMIAQMKTDPSTIK